VPDTSGDTAAPYAKPSVGGDAAGRDDTSGVSAPAAAMALVVSGLVLAATM
jgi:hypothetical protein